MTEIPGSVKVIGLRGKVDSVEDFISSAQEFFGSSKSLFQFFNADLVLGKEHIISAYEHAKRSFESENNISQSLAMEILIYVSGEVQIASALKKVGIKDGSERIAMIVDEGLDLDGLLVHLGFKQDDEVLEFSESKLEKFGIGKEEKNSVSPDKIKDLILERVALVDVRK
jgi:KEOPS complex subunit Cgi121